MWEAPGGQGFPSRPEIIRSWSLPAAMRLLNAPSVLPAKEVADYSRAMLRNNTVQEASVRV